MDEALTNRINVLMDRMVSRLEEASIKAPVEALPHVAGAVFSLYSLKEGIKSQRSRSELEEKAIQTFVDNFQREINGGVKPKLNIDLP